MWRIRAPYKIVDKTASWQGQSPFFVSIFLVWNWQNVTVCYDSFSPCVLSSYLQVPNTRVSNRQENLDNIGYKRWNWRWSHACKRQGYMVGQAKLPQWMPKTLWNRRLSTISRDISSLLNNTSKIPCVYWKTCFKIAGALQLQCDFRKILTPLWLG